MSDTEADAAGTEPRAFTHYLIELEDGVFHQDLSHAMRDLLQAIQDTGKGGTLTLNLKLRPAADGTITSESDFKVTAPKGKRRQTLHFVTPELNLVRSNPRQPDLPLRQVKADDAPVRRVDAG